MTIRVKESPTADTRTCDFSKVTREQLLQSSKEHIKDVQAGIVFLICQLLHSGTSHDHDKIEDIDTFHRDFLTGFKTTEWWDEHRKLSRHHLGQEDGIPKDVNLIDVLEMIVDCVMAGMARSGSVRPLELDKDVLKKALRNTVELLKNEIVIVPSKDT